MASVPCTVTGLGRLLELGDLPRQRDGLGTDSLILCLAQSIGAATDAILRNCTTYGAMITAGWVEATFSNWAPKILGPSDRTITYVTASSPYSASLAIPAAQVWNPAGGAVNNNAIVKSVLLYQNAPGVPLSSCVPLGICDATGGATGGSYTHTFGTLTSQAT